MTLTSKTPSLPDTQLTL